MSYTMICAIFNILGIYLANNTDLLYVLFTTLAGFIIVSVKGLFCRKINPAIFLALIMLSVGGASYSYASYNKLYEAFPYKFVTVTGTVVSSPTKSSGDYCNKYFFQPQSVSYLDKTVESDNRLIIRTKVPYRYGDILEVTGFLRELSGGNNEYDFDYSLSYKSKGVHNQITAFESKKIGEINPYNPRYLLGSIKNFIHEAIFHNYGGEKAAIYNAILLGDKSYFSGDYSARLLKTGLWQGLYSPYIHIIILTLIAGIFRTGKGKSRATLTLLLLYALANSGNPNAIKASLLAGLVLLFRMVFGYSDKLQQLAFIALCATVFNPMLCYNRGFVMSVSSTIVLLVFYPSGFRIIQRLLKKLHISSRKIASFLTVAVTLTIGNMPLCAYLFNGTSIYSTLITTLIIPVIFVVLAVSVIHIPLLAFGVSMGFTSAIIDRLLNFIEKLPSYIEKIPLHHIPLKTPSITEIITAYCVMWLCVQLLDGKRRSEMFKVVSSATLAMIVCVCILGQSSGLEIYFVNVGQGDSAILHTSENETILIDGGGAAEYEEDYNVGDEVLVPYMISHGLPNIDYAVVTHFHKDHAQGIVSAARHLKVKNIVMPDTTPENEYRIALEALAKEKGINIIYAKKDSIISFKSGLTVKFLSPDENQLNSDDLNETSLVAQINYHHFCGLFTGDSNDKVDDDYPRYIDILKVSHHGSDTASTQEDINHLCPKFAVISVGEDNPHGHPDDMVAKNLENVNARILRTDVLGDIRFKINKNGKIYYNSLRKE